jgi:hypothetical protein
MNVRKSVPQIIVTNNSKMFNNKIKKVNNLILVTFFLLYIGLVPLSAPITRLSKFEASIGGVASK